MPRRSHLTTGRLTAGQRAGWITAITGVPLLTVGGLFWLTDDDVIPYAGSEIAERYAFPVNGPGEELTSEVLDARFGREGGRETLILYDAEAGDGDAEVLAIAAANLATHFGMAELVPIADYESGALESFDAALYLGTHGESEVPRAVAQDVRSSEVPVLWIGENAEVLAAVPGPAGQSFVQQYGWNPEEGTEVDGTRAGELQYRERTLPRLFGPESRVTVPQVVDPERVETLASARCTDDQDEPIACVADPAAPGAGEGFEPKNTVPWVIRSENLTYLAENPFGYIDRNGLYLVFADLYYDLLAPDTEPTRHAAIRLEDVNPDSDPEQLRAVADYLSGEQIPFQVAVIPIMVDRAPRGEHWIGKDLNDSPQVVEALQYMQERGGTLIQHGTTHQYGAVDNPYSGRTGEDYEFYMHGCSETELPDFIWEDCAQDSWIRPLGPVPLDRVEDHRRRMAEGRQVMEQAGLGTPRIFETPHYSASANASVAMAQDYQARYEQVTYFSGLTRTGQLDPDRSFAQIFPYTVTDIYGSTVYPENLENIALVEQNNHPQRTPEHLLEKAENNLVVRESTASFFFHPFLDLDLLRETVDGIRDLGYTFVAVEDLG